MVIKDANYVKSYIKIDLNDEFESPEKQTILELKNKSRKMMAQKLSYIKIDYIRQTIDTLS